MQNCIVEIAKSISLQLVCMDTKSPEVDLKLLSCSYLPCFLGFSVSVGPSFVENDGCNAPPFNLHVGLLLWLLCDVLLPCTRCK